MEVTKLKLGPNYTVLWDEEGGLLVKPGDDGKLEEIELPVDITLKTRSDAKAFVEKEALEQGLTVEQDNEWRDLFYIH